MTNYKDILLEIGYSNIIDNGREFRMKPIYRESSSNTVLSVRKDSGYFIDFSKNISGSFANLVKLSLDMKSLEEADKWLANSVGPITEIKKPKPKIDGVKTLSKESLNKIVPDDTYWLNRGISKETLKPFGGGIIKEGKMANRYSFPIFNYKKDLVGVSGRYTRPLEEDSKVPKWKHIGQKKHWKYPLQVNSKIIRKKKKAILVESIGDMLSLWEAGIYYPVVTFGLNISNEIINLFLKIDIDKIYISFNNDDENNMAGNLAAEKAEKKLLKYFDSRQVCVKLPPKKDFGEMSGQEITAWHDAL
jgi:hypothetical protein